MSLFLIPGSSSVSNVQKFILKSKNFAALLSMDEEFKYLSLYMEQVSSMQRSSSGYAGLTYRVGSWSLCCLHLHHMQHFQFPSPPQIKVIIRLSEAEATKRTVYHDSREGCPALTGESSEGCQTPPHPASYFSGYRPIMSILLFCLQPACIFLGFAGNIYRAEPITLGFFRWSRA